jgi:hypothetical protein
MRTILGRVSTLVITALLVAAVVLVVSGRDSSPADAQTTAATFTSQSPSRIFDTRGGARPVGGQQMTVQTGQAGATAAAVNLTITDTEGWGFLTAWPSGSQPDTSVINADGAGQTIANGVIVPLAPNGSFLLWPSTGMHVLVDLTGVFRPVGGSVAPPSGGGITATITGYGPGFSITEVSGTATNGTSETKRFRIDVDCPNGTTETTTLFNVSAGATRGWTVLCDGVFTSGARIARVVEV